MDSQGTEHRMAQGARAMLARSVNPLALSAKPPEPYKATMTDMDLSAHFNTGLVTEYGPLQRALDAAWETLAPFAKPNRGRQEMARVHFDLLMLNIIDNRGGVLIVSMDNNHYAPSRYNPQGVTKALIKMTQRLAGAGLMSLEMGDFTDRKRTELTPGPKLLEMFADLHLPIGVIKDVSESVCLKDDRTVLIDYEETERTQEWREQLTRYNDALAETHLWLRDADDPTKGLLLSSASTRHRRIFNRGSFECGGRLYSSRLQNLKGPARKLLYIDGERTIEPDFKGLHIAIAYAKEGIDCIGDPYAFYEQVPQADEDTRSVTRQDAKKLALIAINADSRQGAAMSFRDKADEGLSNKTRRKLYDAMLAQHSAIKHYFGSDSGIRFMRHDSDIMLLALSTLLDMGIVAVPVHDSLVVAMKHEHTAIKVMKQAAEAVLAEEGRTVSLAVEQPDPTYDLLISQGKTSVLREWWREDEAVRKAIGLKPTTALDKALQKPSVALTA